MPDIMAQLSKGANANDLGKSDSKDDTTVDPRGDSPLVKHPLQHTWTLWYYKNDPDFKWEENQRKVITFKHVEDFWALYNHIELASKLRSGCDYSLFKEGIKPMWEDRHNKAGGRWLLTMNRNLRASTMDTFWLEVMMSLIGEVFGNYAHVVNGAVCSIRPKVDKIALWLSNSDDFESVMAVGRCLKAKLGLDRQHQIVFEAHDDTRNKHGSMAKSKYVV